MSESSDGGLYGLAEFAEAAGVSRHLIAQWRHRGKLPPPIADLRSGPVWTGLQVEAFLGSMPEPGTEATAADVDHKAAAAVRGILMDLVREGFDFGPIRRPSSTQASTRVFAPDGDLFEVSVAELQPTGADQ